MRASERHGVVFPISYSQHSAWQIDGVCAFVEGVYSKSQLAPGRKILKGDSLVRKLGDFLL